MFSGWRTSPEDTLRERTKLASRDLRHNAYKQEELRRSIKQLEAAIAKEKNPIEKRRLVVALVTKQRQLDGEIDDGMRTQRTIATMEKSKMMCRRHDDAKALAASMSAMSRGATPTSVARIQETLLTAQSSLEITGDMLDDMDRPAPDEQQTIDDQVDSMMDMFDSRSALEIGATMPDTQSFPAIPTPSPAPSPHPHPSLHDIEQRLARLLTN